MFGPGQMLAVYDANDRSCLQVGSRWQDLSAGDGFYPGGWTSEQVVALFATGADWEVEAARHEADLLWVTRHTTCS